MGGFMPASGSGAAHLLDGVESDVPLIPTIRELWAQAQAFRSSPFMQKISADLQSGPGMGTISLSRVMSGEPFSLMWMDLWYNNGFIHDDANLYNPNDSMVPNAASSDEGRRYTLPFDFLTTPSDMLLSDMAWGLGNEYSGIRGWHLANVRPNVFPDFEGAGDSIDASDHALPVLGFTSPTTLDAPSITRVDARIAIGPGALAGDIGTELTAQLIAAIGGDDWRISESRIADHIAQGAIVANGALGWRRVFQFTNSAATNDEFEGFMPEAPQVGRRYYADPFTIQSHAYDRYRTLVGLK